MFGLATGAVAPPVPHTSVDLSRRVAGLRSGLSGPDVERLDAMVASAQHVLREVCGRLEPGVAEREVAARLTAALSRTGGQMVLTHVACGRYRGQSPTVRPLVVDELVTVVAEFADANGLWAEVGMLVGWSRSAEAATRMRADADTLRDCLAAAVAAMIPGRPVADAAAVMQAVLREAGGAAVERLGHGVGVDECPPNIACGDAAFRAGTAFAVHPSLRRAGAERCAGLFGTAVIAETGSRLLGDPHFDPILLR